MTNAYEETKEGAINTIEALQESEEKFRALFESAKDGYTVEKMLSMDLQDLDMTESAQLTSARLQRLLAGETMSFEIEHYCNNGQTIPLEVSANMILIGDKKYILGFHRDITERKLAEDALRENEARLKVALI